MAAKPGEVPAALAACRRYFVNAAIFSLAINLLYLASPLYLLQIYDRVVASSSVMTLVMLTLAVLLAFLALAGLDLVRARLLARASIRLNRRLAGRVMTAVIDGGGSAQGGRSQPLRDLDTFRQFVTGSGIHALFDLPWTPVYLFVIFLLHPLLGAFALFCAVILVLLALAGEWLVRAPLKDANEAANRNYSFTEMSLRNADVVQAMGMTEGLLKRWNADRTRMIDRQIAASDRGATMSSLIRFLRLSMQSLILGIGAYLAIDRAVTPGAIFAGSVLLGRSLHPVEQIVGSWRGLMSAREAFLRIRALLAARPPQPVRLELPAPEGRLVVEALSYAVPQRSKPILRNVSFRLEPGEALGIIGPSGSGKSTLARHIVGILAPSAGAVRLDGADISTWPRASLGKHIGYLPQDVELFADAVAANIGRFDPESAEAVVKAAIQAGVHDMILRLPDGYETQVGDGGAVLSCGCRQRIALARAVLGDPRLVVLDEPSSNLDADGDAALAACILALKRSRTTVLVISHRPSTIAVVDKILVLVDGAVEAFGPRTEMMARFAPHPPLVSPAAAGGARGRV